MTAKATLEQLCMAHRYLYYVWGKPVISDHEYDALERRALKRVGPSSPLHRVGSDREQDYSDAVKAVAKVLQIGAAYDQREAAAKRTTNRLA